MAAAPARELGALMGIPHNKIDRNWTPLEIFVAETIYFREAIGAGVFKKLQAFNAVCPTRQMSRALLDARAAIKGLHARGFLTADDLAWSPMAKEAV